jgi:hypothetical protein
LARPANASIRRSNLLALIATRSLPRATHLVKPMKEWANDRDLRFNFRQNKKSRPKMW